MTYFLCEENTKTRLSQLYDASESAEAPRLPEVKMIYDAGRLQTAELLNELTTAEQ